jgi:CBS domain-containing protein
VGIQSSLREALIKIREFEDGAALIVENDRVKGIFSERDFARMVLESNANFSLDASVAQVMRKRVVYVTEEYSLDECLAVMSMLKIRHLPVLDGETPIALLSLPQIVESLIGDREYLIGELVNYITGGCNHQESRPEHPQIRELQTM